MIKSPSNEDVRDKILELGYDLNPMKGVDGNFYTDRRIRDLKQLACQIIKERE